jgi:pyruvate formate lyase activating enzyme
MMPQDVAARVLPNRALLEMAGGGVTFSGGEPLLQADFVIELTRALSTVHLCMETSGYAPEDVFTRAVDCMDLVIMDIKLADTREHRRWTGVGNELIKRNLEALKQSGKPFWIRIPMIPGVTDGEQNMRETAEFLRSARHLQKVELLRYNKAAGAKYAGLDMVYAPTFSEKEPPQTLVDIFKEANIPCAVL